MIAVERFGFDSMRLRFTLRTAVAACCALLIAWWGGLEHPQWSAMTVWAVSQPARGHLLEKSLFRAIGTIIGCLFGVLLLVVSGGNLWVTIVGLALWLGLCAGTGNIVRGFVSYGAMLAGYSAAMAALLHSAESASPLAIGIDRILTVLLGLFVALPIGWIFTSTARVEDPRHRVRRLTGRILGALADHLEGATSRGPAEYHHLLSEMAKIEEGLDGHAAGSVRLRDDVRSLRRLLSAQVGLLLWMRRPLRPIEAVELMECLRSASESYELEHNETEGDVALHRAIDLTFDSALKTTISGLAKAMVGQRSALPTERRASPEDTVHRDWVGARQATVRTIAVILAVGAVWLGTGWEAGAFMLLGTSIMMTVFSTVEYPALTLREVLLGQILGVSAALACRWLAWPMAESELGLVLFMLPLILFGGFLFAYPRTSGPIGYDFNMIVLLLLQPAWPLMGHFSQSLSIAAAVILGPTVSLIAFHVIYPVNGHKRLRILHSMMVHEIEALAARKGASRQRPIWSARLYHRVLRLVLWADKMGANREDIVANTFACMLAGSTTMHLDEILQRTDLAPATVRRLKVPLARMRALGSSPRRVARSLGLVANRFASDPTIDSELLRETAAVLAEQRLSLARL